MRTAGSAIRVTEPVLESLKADGDVQEGMYERRPDGDFNLFVSAPLRAKLDRWVVRTGLDYSTLLERLREAANVGS